MGILDKGFDAEPCHGIPVYPEAKSTHRLDGKNAILHKETAPKTRPSEFSGACGAETFVTLSGGNRTRAVHMILFSPQECTAFGAI